MRYFVPYAWLFYIHQNYLEDSRQQPSANILANQYEGVNEEVWSVPFHKDFRIDIWQEGLLECTGRLLADARGIGSRRSRLRNSAGRIR